MIYDKILILAVFIFGLWLLDEAPAFFNEKMKIKSQVINALLWGVLGYCLVAGSVFCTNLNLLSSLLFGLEISAFIIICSVTRRYVFEKWLNTKNGKR